MYILTNFFCFISLVLLVVGQGTNNSLTVVLYNDTQISYTGNWNDFFYTPDQCTRMTTTTVGDFASFHFRGTEIQVYVDHDATVTPVVQLDNVTQTVIPAESAGCRELLFAATGLPATEHTVEVRYGSGSGRMFVWSFEYISSPLPVSSTSITSSTHSTQLGSPTASATSPTASAASPAESSPSNSRHLKGGAIAGIVVGVVAGVAAFGLAVLAFLRSENGAYLLSALAGLFAWKSRRLIFKAPESLGQTQISLFLTSEKRLEDFKQDTQDKPVVWQVFNIGGAQRQFMVDIPCVTTGNTKLGFASVEDSNMDAKVVQCGNGAQAPARLIDNDEWEYEGSEEREPVKKAKSTKKDLDARPKLVARNTSDFRVRIAVGTYNEDEGKVQPLLLVENFSKNGEYEVKDDLYLHAFRTNGYKVGQYGKSLVEDIAGDRITNEIGIKLSDLKPITTWLIKSDPAGKLALEIVGNSRKDVKSYQHKCRIKGDAKV